MLRPQSRIVFVHSAHNRKVNLRRDLLNIICVIAQCMVGVWCICQSGMLLHLARILPWLWQHRSQVLRIVSMFCEQRHIDTSSNMHDRVKALANPLMAPNESILLPVCQPQSC